MQNKLKGWIYSEIGEFELSGIIWAENYNERTKVLFWDSGETIHRSEISCGTVTLKGLIFFLQLKKKLLRATVLQPSVRWPGLTDLQVGNSVLLSFFILQSHRFPPINKYHLELYFLCHCKKGRWAY